VTDLDRIAGRAWRTPPVVTLLALLLLWLRGGLQIPSIQSITTEAP